MKNIVAAATLLVAVAPAFADDSAEPFFRQGWYATPMATYMKPDKARCNVDGGFGGALALGNRGEVASLEAWGQYLSLSHGECSYVTHGTDAAGNPTTTPVTEPSGEVKLNGGGLDVVLGPYGDVPVLRHMFGLIGFGVLRREGEPQYKTNASTIFGDLGAGYWYPFTLFGHDVAARAEARYRYDVQQPPYPTSQEEDPPPEHAFQDWIFNVGLQIDLSPHPHATPEARAQPVSVVPVAETDADHDGVPDGKDQCPETPAGEMVDESGCAAAKKVTIADARAGDTIVLEGVNFETASSRLTVNAQTILDDVAKQLNARPDVKVEIGGHTDNRGSDSYNQTLSERRAQSVVAYLTEHGVDASRLSAKGYGKGGAVDTNDTDEGRERNRRVELKVLDTDAVAGTTQAPADTTTPATDTTAPAADTNADAPHASAADATPPATPDSGTTTQ